jgi:glycosyltransferase involved in cell wall biosynthesis
MEACKLTNPAAGKADCLDSVFELARERPPLDLSIIICTRNRAEALRGCLESLSQAVSNNTNVRSEIVIVDNGSTDHTRDVISTWTHSAPCPVLLIEEPRPGLGAARNSGIRSTSGRLIAFTDDDCRLGPHYVPDLMRNFQNDDVPVIRGGRVELGDPDDLPFGVKVDDTETVLKYPLHPGSIALGCNMVINRDVFRCIGLFDERFGAGAPFKASEETELFFRAHLRNIPVIYVPNMTVYHFHGRKSIDVARKQYGGYFIGNGALYAKYMFSEGGLLKHLYWDLRKALFPVRHGQSLNEEPLVSRLYMMSQLMAGMILYWATCISEFFHRERSVPRHLDERRQVR